MIKKSRKILHSCFSVVMSLVLITVCSISNFSIVFAESTQDLKNKLSEYDKKIAQAEESISALKGDMSKTRQYITELDSQIADYQEQINLLQGTIDKLQAEIDALQKKIDEKNAEIKKLTDEINANKKKIEELHAQIEGKKAELKNQIRNMYMNGETSSLEVLLCSDDFSDFLVKEQYVSSLADYEKELVEAIKGTVKEIENANGEIKKQQEKIKEAKAEIQLQQSGIQVKQNAVQSQQNAVDDKQSAIEVKRGEANAQLSALKSSSASYSSLIAEYENGKKEVEAEIQRKLNSGGSTGSGASSGGLVWPMSGSCYISSYMKGRINPVTGYAETHGGIDICTYGGTYGRPISAAASGRVVIASSHYSYGNYVMIDHGNGLSTLYAHCSSLNVYEGQSVSQGQTIAYAGSSGYVTGPHLHFEVRVNGSRVDPLNYVSMP